MPATTPRLLVRQTANGRLALFPSCHCTRNMRWHKSGSDCYMLLGYVLTQVGHCEKRRVGGVAWARSAVVIIGSAGSKYLRYQGAAPRLALRACYSL